MPQPRNMLRPAAARLADDLRLHADTLTAGPLDPEADALPNSRRGRRLLWADGLVSNTSEAFVASFVNPLALALGATNTQMGWLSSLSNLAAALALFPGARLCDTAPSRRRIVVLSSAMARALLLVIALAPLVFGGQAAIYALIALVSLRAFFSQLLFPAWSAFLADLVPASIRGRYFATRNIGLAFGALVFTPVAGWLAGSMGLPAGYQVSFVIAGLIGFLASGIFSRIPEQPKSDGPATKTRRESVWRMLRTHPRFAAFTAVAVIWNLSIMVAGPFFSVYLVRNLAATPLQIGLLTAVNSLTNIIGQRVWGRINDRRGATWVTRVTGLMIPLVPALWAVAPSAWVLILVEMLSGFAWSGYSLANFNLMLSLAPGEERPRYTAVYQAGVFGAAFIGPLMGSVLANTLNIPILFWISAGGRVVAQLLFMLTVRDDVETVR